MGGFLAEFPAFQGVDPYPRYCWMICSLFAGLAELTVLRRLGALALRFRFGFDFETMRTVGGVCDR